MGGTTEDWDWIVPVIDWFVWIVQYQAGSFPTCTYVIWRTHQSGAGPFSLRPLALRDVTVVSRRVQGVFPRSCVDKVRVCVR